MKLPFILAKRFVAGEALADAVPKVRELNRRGIAASLDLLGENVKDRATADATLVEYVNLLNEIKHQGLDSNISIKITMMGLDIDRTYAKDNLFRLLEVAKENHQFVRIDMEGSPYTQTTIDLLKDAHLAYPGHVGTVIQAYLKRSVADIRDLSDLGADIRLCKGAYKESSDIAHTAMSDIRQSYQRLAKILLEKTPFPRFATHDDQLINWLKEYASEQNIRPKRFEFQMLYGLRQKTCEALVEDRYKVRVYVPYGTMWFPYFSRRLRERKENVFFVVAAMFRR
jgi:proline dehydrogenase